MVDPKDVLVGATLYYLRTHDHSSSAYTYMEIYADEVLSYPTKDYNGKVFLKSGNYRSLDNLYPAYESAWQARIEIYTEWCTTRANEFHRAKENYKLVCGLYKQAAESLRCDPFPRREFSEVDEYSPIRKGSE